MTDPQSTRPESVSLQPAEPEASRRGFLKSAVALMCTVAGVALGIPLIVAIGSVKSKRTSGRWMQVAKVDSLNVGEPSRTNFKVVSVDAYQRHASLQSLWLIKRPAGEVTAYSPICTHLGCYFNWNPQTRHFECPCHASVFRIDGAVIAGPAPRPLDALPVKVEDGAVFVQWKLFKVGVSQKVSIDEGA